MVDNVVVEYILNSPIGEIEGNRYINHFLGRITATDDYGKEETVIGDVDIKIFLLGTAMNEGFHAFDIFDNPQFLWNEGFEIYDVQKQDFNNAIESFYPDLIQQDICLIHSIQLIADYRGKGIGKQIMKDIFLRFTGGCGLFIVDTFPKQFAYDITESEIKKYQYDLLPSNEQEAKDSLHSYFLQLGFDKVLNNSLRFLLPENRNTLFSSIVIG